MMMMITITHQQFQRRWGWWCCGSLVKLIRVNIYESFRNNFKSLLLIKWIKNDSLSSESVRFDMRYSNCLTHEDDRQNSQSNCWSSKSGNEGRLLYKSTKVSGCLFPTKVGGALWSLVSGSWFDVGDILLWEEEEGSKKE
jgi:hypothetical protein